MASAWKIAAEMGITIASKKSDHRKGPLPPKTTRSRATIRLIAEQGEAIGYKEMVYDVIGLFLASEANQTMLYGDLMMGVAGWIKAANLRTADIPFIRPAFCEIDLGTVREAVAHYRIPNRPPQISFMLAGFMEPAVEAIDLGRRRA